MYLPNQARGFTLVEMMIAVALSALLLTAAYQVMVSQSRVYEAQQQTLDMQQNARAALDFMCRELRMAGYGVATGTDIFSNLVNNDAASASIDDETDAMTFVGNTNYGTLVLNPAIPTDVTLNVFPAPAQTMEFNNGDVVDILLGDKTLLMGGVPIIGVANGNPATPTANPTVVTFGAALGVDIPAGSYVMIQPRTISYRINNSTLERNDGGGWQDLIDNAEDLQLVYSFDGDGDGDIDTDANGIIWAVDTDSDGSLDTQVNANGSTAGLGTPVAINGDVNNCLIRAVRVSLLVRTVRQAPSFPLIGARPQVEDRAAAGANDRFRRRLLRSVVKFRNLGLGD